MNQKIGEMKNIVLKNVTLEVLKNLPDNVCKEEMMYQVDLISEVLEGINDAKEGNVFTTEEVLGHFATKSDF